MIQFQNRVISCECLSIGLFLIYFIISCEYVYICIHIVCMYVYACICMCTRVCLCEFMCLVTCYSISDSFGEIRTVVGDPDPIRIRARCGPDT